MHNVADDYIEVMSADDARAEDRAANVHTGHPTYLNPGTLYIYWKDPAQQKLRGVYNIPRHLEQVIVDRIMANRSADYLALVGDVPGTAYGDQMTQIQIVK